MNMKLFSFIFVVLFFIVYVFTAIFLSNLLYPIKYYRDIDFFCNEYNVDKCLVYAMIKAESNFNTTCISKVGAVGLMQLMPNTANFIADKIDFQKKINLYDSRINLNLGIAYVSYLQNKFSNESVVICAYNAGEGEVLNWLNSKGGLEKIKFYETKIYLEKVKYAKKVYAEKLKYIK